MPVKLQITCVAKSTSQQPYARIAHVGGGNVEHRWKITQEDAIRGIEKNDWEFYVYQKGAVVNVVVAEKEGNKYLKTLNDEEQPENLLMLPEW